jgi:urease accessory protein
MPTPTDSPVTDFPVTDALATAQLLYLLQLASPSLPVGAYSYSEGLETLVTTGRIQTADELQTWLEQELTYGTIQVETAVMVHLHQITRKSLELGEPLPYCQLRDWNAWLSAWRETAELRQQSWQMGRSLLRLLQNLEIVDTGVNQGLDNQPCHFALSFALAAAHWHLDPKATGLAYLQTWSSNLVMAGIKLIPLGQTAGQRLILDLHPTLTTTIEMILTTPLEAMQSCSWGLNLASMQHETQYSRLFRS